MDKPDIELVKTRKGTTYKTKKTSGRPEKLNQKIIDKMCMYLRMGLYLETALTMVGISRTTFKTYVEKGKAKPKSIHGVFLQAIDRSLAEADVRDMQVIDRTAQGSETKFLRYDKGTIDPETGLDVSGQLVFEEGRYGKNVVVQEQGIAPNWQAAAWKLQQRAPLRYAINKDREDNLGKEIKDNANDETFTINFVKTGVKIGD